MATKHDMVKNYLKGGATLTSLEAIRIFGDTRLAATVHKLKEEGFNIETKTIRVKDRWGKNCDVAQYKMHLNDQMSLL